MEADTISEVSSISIEIDAAFAPFVPAALLKLQTYFPDHRFSFMQGTLCATGRAGFHASALQAAMRHAIYREKIYAETLDMRRSLVGAVLGS